MTADQPAPDRTGPPLAPTVFALGIVGLLVVVTPDAPRAPYGQLGIAAGLGAIVLAGSLVRTEAPFRAAGVFLVSVVVLSAIAVGLWRTSDGLWLGALGLLLVGGTLSYGLHRYERVRLGLVEEAEP